MTIRQLMEQARELRRKDPRAKEISVPREATESLAADWLMALPPGHAGLTLNETIAEIVAGRCKVLGLQVVIPAPVL